MSIPRARRVVLAFLLLAVTMPIPGRAQAPAPPRDTVVLDLASVTRIVAERSAAVRIERLATEEAGARADESRSVLLPHVSLDALHGQHTFNTASFGLEFPTAPGQEPLFDPNGEVIGPVTTVDVRGHVSQTLLDLSALERLRASQANVDASNARVDDVRARATFAAAGAYVQAVRAAGRLAAREADLALAEDLVDVARETLAAGVGVRIDVTRAEAQLAGVQAEMVMARATADRAQLALLRSLGLPLDTPVRLADAFLAPLDDEQASYVAEPTVDVDAEAAVAAAIAHRTDLREIDLRIDAARLDVTAVHAERFPTISLALTNGFNGKGYGNLLDTHDWGVRVTVPLFDGMHREAREQEEELQVTALEERRKDLADQIAFEVRDALQQLTSTRELVHATQVRLSLAEAELTQARERFQAGVAGSADVFTASIRLNEARTAEVDARAANQAARVALATAEGAVEALQ